MTEEQVQKMVEDALPGLAIALKEDLLKSITYEVRQRAVELVWSEIKKWLEAVIVPTIRGELMDQKDGLMALAGTLAPRMVEALVEATFDAFTKRLAQSWERDKMLAALFGKG